MIRAYLPPAAWTSARLELGEDASRHIVQVLRRREGDPVQVLDGTGRIAETKIASVAKRSVTVEIVSESRLHRPAVSISIAVALLREQKMDLVIQKATELGAAQIFPFLPDHAVVQWKEDRSAHKMERWREIAVGSIEQCGSPWLPAIHEPQGLSGVLGKISADVRVYGALGGAPASLKSVLESKSSARSFCAAIGPEGDFSESEIRTLNEAAWSPVSLGSLVLRAETAAMYFLSVFKHHTAG